MSLYRCNIFLTKATLNDFLADVLWICPNPASLNQEKTSSGLVLGLTNFQHFKNSSLSTFSTSRAVVITYQYFFLFRSDFKKVFHLEMISFGRYTIVSLLRMRFRCTAGSRWCCEVFICNLNCSVSEKECACGCKCQHHTFSAYLIVCGEVGMSMNATNMGWSPIA